MLGTCSKHLLTNFTLYLQVFEHVNILTMVATVNNIAHLIDIIIEVAD